MTDEATGAQPQEKRRTPWWFWPISALTGLFLLINCAGLLLTYVMNGEYLAGLSEAQIAYMNATPLWDTIIWAAAHILAPLGSLLLLLRRKGAFPVFLGAALLFAISTIYTIGFTPMIEVFGPTSAVYHVVSLVVLAILVRLSSWGRKVGILH